MDGFDDAVVWVPQLAGAQPCAAALRPTWALRGDDVVQVTSLSTMRRVRPDGGGPVLVSEPVRTNDPQQPQPPPTLHLDTRCT